MLSFPLYPHLKNLWGKGSQYWTFSTFQSAYASPHVYISIYLLFPGSELLPMSFTVCTKQIHPGVEIRGPLLFLELWFLQPSLIPQISEFGTI